jgi:hypothetical protein
MILTLSGFIGLRIHYHSKRRSLSIKVNWAYASGQREDTLGHYSIFVGDLSPEVTYATLFACFSIYQVVQMQGLCGIKNLAGQGDLAWFPS